MHALIIGDGWVANNRHKPAFNKLKITYDSADIKTGYPRDYESYDFVLLSVPPHVRLDVFKLCVEKGIKKIFLEKPIATTIEDAHEIMQLALKNNIDVRNCHNFIFANVGLHILNSSDRIGSPIFTQFNRTDRHLPKWVNEIPMGISLDEFAHIGYLSRIFSPELGLRDPDVIFKENTSSPINKWDVQWVDSEGFKVADLWRDAVYINKGVGQTHYWQYKEEFLEGAQRIKSVLYRVTQRLIGRTNDFGTTSMWKAFLTNELTPRQDQLTSLTMAVKILEDFYFRMY